MGDAITCVDGHDGTGTQAGDATRSRSLLVQARRIGFAAIALFILLAPAAGQVFGVHHLLLREWVMYSGVGVGIPKGEFRIWQEDEPVATLSPLEALDLAAYPPVIHYTFSHRILSDDDFPRFAARLCGALADHGGDRVSFEGKVGTRQGWRPANHSDLCAPTDHRVIAADSSWELRRED
jgi:hypothetical protein